MVRSALYVRLLAYACLFSFLFDRATAQDCIQPPSDMIAWWPLDETSGDVADDVAGAFDGAYTNSPVPVPGKVGGALSFNGSTSFVTAPDSAEWELGTSDFTIALWARFNSTDIGSVGHPAAIFIANDEGPSSVAKWFFAWGGGFLNFHVNSPSLGPQFFPLVPFTPVIGQWYHLAVRRRFNTFTIFIDGVPAGSEDRDYFIPDPVAPLTLGQGENIGFMNGALDEVMLFRRALSDAEIDSIHASGSGGLCKSFLMMPTEGGNTGNVTVRFSGRRFDNLIAATLSNTGFADIPGTGIGPEAGGVSAIATFDLTNAPLGNWTMTLQFNGEDDIAVPFRVVEGGPPQLAVEVVGLPVFRVNSGQIYYGFFHNIGNVNAGGRDGKCVLAQLQLYPVGGQDDFVQGSEAMLPSIGPGQTYIMSFGVYATLTGCYELRGIAAVVTCGEIMQPDSEARVDDVLSLCTIASFDPNSKSGALGAGDEQYVKDGAFLPYTIQFENKAAATAPAREVLVEDDLDTGTLNLETFEFGPVQIGPNQYLPAPSSQSFSLDTPIVNGLVVRVEGSLDPNSGKARWFFQSIDPATGLPPTDPTAGFLPPNVTPPEGEGSVVFTVRSRVALATDTPVVNDASIIFDTNEPIVTDPWSNVIDAAAPATGVNPLTPTKATTTFEVTWGGTDAGAGIRYYTVFVSDNGGPYTIWQNKVPHPSAEFTGIRTHTYSFYSVAVDFVGNVEVAPLVPDATTTIGALPDTWVLQ